MAVHNCAQIMNHNNVQTSLNNRSSNQNRKHLKNFQTYGMISVPHLGEKRMVPNTNDGLYITQIKSKNMMSMGNDCPGCKSIKKWEGLRFDSNHNDFHPLDWPFVHQLGSEPQHFVLLPQNVDCGSTHGSIVFTGCTNIDTIHELQPIITATQMASKYTTEVRNGKGEGSMYSYSLMENFGKATQCAIHISNKVIRQQKKQQYYTALGQCGALFWKYFEKKCAGYENMCKNIKIVKPDSHDHLLPSCYLTSKNLGNSEHLDIDDHSRSFAFWVTTTTTTTPEGVFLLFPQWGLAIQLGHGRYISWHGNEVPHCTSVGLNTTPARGDIFSIFTALPLSLFKSCSKKQTMDDIKEDRRNSEESATTFFKTLEVGLRVLCNVCPESTMKKLSTLSKGKKGSTVVKKQYYRKYRIVGKVDSHIELVSEFSKRYQKLSKEEAYNRVVVLSHKNKKREKGRIVAKEQAINKIF